MFKTIKKVKAVGYVAVNPDNTAIKVKSLPRGDHFAKDGSWVKVTRSEGRKEIHVHGVQR